MTLQAKSQVDEQARLRADAEAAQQAPLPSAAATAAGVPAKGLEADVASESSPPDKPVRWPS